MGDFFIEYILALSDYVSIYIDIHSMVYNFI